MLYGIPPRAMGTGDVESLFSHLLSLSFAHRLAPKQVVGRILPELESRQDEPLPARQCIGWAWDKYAGKEMLGMTRMTERWVTTMESATGLDGLRYATLLPLKSHTYSDLITEEDRACLDCLAVHAETNELPYGRLLWRLKAVTCCPIHRKRLLVPTCGNMLRATQIKHVRIKHSGVCHRCTSIGYLCSHQQADEATHDEVWRAEQCRKMLAALPAIDAVDPNAMRKAVKSQCTERGAVSSLAFRCGAPKSVLSRWMKEDGARLGFDQILDLCSTEGWELAELLQGRIAPSTNSGGLQPMRTRRRLDPVDHDQIRAALAQAIKDGRTVTQVATELRVDISTLARHRDLYVQVRAASIKRKAEEDEKRQIAIIQSSTSILLSLAARGRRLTPRNVIGVSASRPSPSSTEYAVLTAMRFALGDRSLKRHVNPHRLGQRFVERINEAVENLQLESNELQRCLPLSSTSK